MTSLREATTSSRILVTCGAGGIGKTTAAAALGVALSQSSERRVLVLTIDPARRLADALGLDGIDNDVTPVKEVTGPGKLDVAMLDTRASWDSLIHRHAPDDETAQRILSNSLYQNITGRFIQSHDYIAMERLYELVQLQQYDLIVLDTPPSRNALDFLDAPNRMADFFSSRLLRWLTAPARGGIRGLAAKPFTQITDRILGAQFLSDITEFFVLLESMYAGFIERAREVEALLVDPSTGFLVISTLDEAPLHEAEFFIDELEKRKLRVYGWLLNRVLPASLSSPSLLLAMDELERSSLDDVATDLDVPLTHLSTVIKSLVMNARAWSNVAVRERQQISQLHSSVPLVAVPSLDGEISDLEGLLALGQRILDEPFVLEFGDVQRSESA